MSPRDFRRPPTITIDPQPLLRAAVVGGVLLIVGLVLASVVYVVPPGFRGVQVTLGNVRAEFRPEGLGFKLPMVSQIVPVSVRQRTRSMPAECYSSDLQQVRMELEVLYRVPESAVVRIFQEFEGEPFDTLIAPRVQEALKEAVAMRSAEMVVKQRSEVKVRALELAQRKVGTNLLEVVDLVLFDIRLSPELEQAIEQKMVQEQEAEKAKFTQLKAEIEAGTAVIRARGEAESIGIRGSALAASPEFIQLQMVETWNGRSPLVVGSSGGAGLLLNPAQFESRSQPATNRARAGGRGTGGR